MTMAVPNVTFVMHLKLLLMFSIEALNVCHHILWCHHLKNKKQNKKQKVQQAVKQKDYINKYDAWKWLKLNILFDKNM